jgi:GTP-binding protein LepA
LEEKRGVQKKFEFVSENRVMLVYELPLNEIVLDFYDRLKSVSKGYASLDYHFSDYRESNLVKLDVLVSGEPVRRALARSPPQHRRSQRQTRRPRK